MIFVAVNHIGNEDGVHFSNSQIALTAWSGVFDTIQLIFERSSGPVIAGHQPSVSRHVLPTTDTLMSIFGPFLFHVTASFRKRLVVVDSEDSTLPPILTGKNSSVAPLVVEFFKEDEFVFAARSREGLEQQVNESHLEAVSSAERLQMSRDIQIQAISWICLLMTLRSKSSPSSEWI